MIAHLIHPLTMAVAEQVAVQGGWRVGDGVPVVEPEHILANLAFNQFVTRQVFREIC